MHLEREARLKGFDIMKGESNKPLVSVIIPTYKRRDKLLHCLDSVFSSTYKNIEVIVINDCPEDDISVTLSKYNLRFAQHKSETRLAKSRNEGSELAMGEYLFLVDDDNLLANDCIELLVNEYRKNPNIGILGPLMYDTHGNIWFYGAKATWRNPNPKPVDKLQLSNELIETDVIPNAYFVSKEVFQKIGGEDYKIFPSHHSEVDLAQRLKGLGYKNYIYTKAKTLHDYGSIYAHMDPARLYQTVKSNFIIEKKYADRKNYVIFFLAFVPTHILYYWLYIIPFKCTNKVQFYKSYFNGFLEGIKFKRKMTHSLK